MTFDPATNEKPFALLSNGERFVLEQAIKERGGQIWYYYFGWTDLGVSQLNQDGVYRAKPAPVVKSSWHNVYLDADHAFDSVEVSPPFSDWEEADFHAGTDRIGVARFDLIDGKLSVTLEPLEDKTP